MANDLLTAESCGVDLVRHLAIKIARTRKLPRADVDVSAASAKCQQYVISRVLSENSQKVNADSLPML